ncbi:hypothetical protein OOU_Y34scaffold00090g13 [Pyricularia oryzae Y34]|uniref:Uncharacterized protein n=2 Tax=Pyricularia oryzae TaxID=318829 RepID=A0AA97PRT2_PYRO3|nr:hypothetical protein OOU_Y34scaffold00090g13 [Pyricularia oryzae Y34]
MSVVNGSSGGKATQQLARGLAQGLDYMELSAYPAPMVRRRANRSRPHDLLNRSLKLSQSLMLGCSPTRNRSLTLSRSYTKQNSYGREALRHSFGLIALPLRSLFPRISSPISNYTDLNVYAHSDNYPQTRCNPQCFGILRVYSRLLGSQGRRSSQGSVIRSSGKQASVSRTLGDNSPCMDICILAGIAGRGGL